MTRLFRPRLVQPRRATQVAQALCAVTLSLLLAGGAQAASVYTVQVTQNADLGAVTSGAVGDTTFRSDPATGSVTKLSGTATRASTAATRAQVTVSCAATAASDCSKPINIRLGVVGSPTGRARTLTNLTHAMGTAVLVGGPGSAGAFTIASVGSNSSKTFYVGADMAIGGDDSGLTTGPAESDFFAWAAEIPAVPSSGAVGRFQALVIRSIAIAKTSDLVFGRIAKPTAGLGTVTIDPNSGARTTVGAQGLDSPAPTRATFNVTGEGGQAFTVTVPPTIAMTGPQPMTVTTTSSISGTPLLSGSLGSLGSFAFGIGGSAPIDATTLNGAYSGSFTVTVAYN